MRSSTDGTRPWKPMSASTTTPPLGHLHTWTLLLGAFGEAFLCCCILPVAQILSCAAIILLTYHKKPDRLHCNTSSRWKHTP